jgi:hypothetical protein
MRRLTSGVFGCLVGGEFAHDLPLLERDEVGVILPEPAADTQTDRRRQEVYEESVEDLLRRRRDAFRIELVFPAHGVFDQPGDDTRSDTVGPEIEALVRGNVELPEHEPTLEADEVVRILPRDRFVPDDVRRG